MTDIREALAEIDPSIIMYDNLERACIGVCHRYGQPPIAMYDWNKCIDILMEEDGATYEDAVEHLEVNSLGSWVGDYTPAFLRRFEE